MTATTEKAAAALDLLPKEMREPAVAYLLEQAEKFRMLNDLVAEGMGEVDAGNVSEWDFLEFLDKARGGRRDGAAKLTPARDTSHGH